MAEETVTTYICDGCGKRSTEPDFNDGSTSGKMQLQYKYSQGAKSYDGAWGGTSGSKELLLCMDCGDAILAALRALAAKGGE